MIGLFACLLFRFDCCPYLVTKLLRLRRLNKERTYRIIPSNKPEKKNGDQVPYPMNSLSVECLWIWMSANSI